MLYKRTYRGVLPRIFLNSYTLQNIKKLFWEWLLVLKTVFRTKNTSPGKPEPQNFLDYSYRDQEWATNQWS